MTVSSRFPTNKFMGSFTFRDSLKHCPGSMETDPNPGAAIFITWLWISVRQIYGVFDLHKHHRTKPDTLKVVTFKWSKVVGLESRPVHISLNSSNDSTHRYVDMYMWKHRFVIKQYYTKYVSKILYMQLIIFNIIKQC